MEKPLVEYGSILEKFYQKNKGKLILLFGRPFTGKTTFAIALARKVAPESHKYFAIDTTIPDLEGLNKIPVRSWQELRQQLQSMKTYPKLIVVDSLTTLATEFYKDKLFSPRANLMLARFYDEVLRRLARLRDKTTTLVIAHESLKRFGEEEENAIGPRINENALRHVDIIYRAIRNGGFKIIKWAEREVVAEPKFYIEL